MLHTLLESAATPRSRRSPRTTALSTLLHAGFIAAAVHATGMTHAAPPAAPPHPIIYVAPHVETVNPTSHAVGGLNIAPSTDVVAPPLPVFPTTIEAGITPVSLNTPVINSTEFQHAVGNSVDSLAGSGHRGGVWYAQEVDRPVAMIAGAPTYPETLRSMRVTGGVLAQFVVDTTGRVMPGSYVVIESANPLFTDAVRAAMPSLRFAPARVGQRAVPQLVQQMFRFTVK